MWAKKQQSELDMKHWTGSKLRKEDDKAVYCHPAYLNSMQSTSCKCQADESQAGIKIARRNINNLRYVGDTTLTAHREEELKSLLMRVQDQSEKAVLKLNIQKNNIMASSSITSCQIEGEKVEAVTDFIFLGFKITADGDCSHEIKTLAPWKKSYA